jgi:hypothetical protein
MRAPMMTGHCAFHSTGSHERCERMGAGQRANPSKEFTPCPCPQHFDQTQVYECSECGGDLVLTDWPNDDPEDVDEDGEPYPVYSHIDHSGRALGQVCF